MADTDKTYPRIITIGVILATIALDIPFTPHTFWGFFFQAVALAIMWGGVIMYNRKGRMLWIIIPFLIGGFILVKTFAEHLPGIHTAIQ